MRMRSIYTHVATFDPAPTLALLVVMSWMPWWTSSAKRVARLKGHKRKPVEPSAYKRLENIPWRLGEPVVSEALG